MNRIGNGYSLIRNGKTYYFDENKKLTYCESEIEGEWKEVKNSDYRVQNPDSDLDFFFPIENSNGQEDNQRWSKNEGHSNIIKDYFPEVKDIDKNNNKISKDLNALINESRKRRRYVSTKFFNSSFFNAEIDINDIFQQFNTLALSDMQTNKAHHTENFAKNFIEAIGDSKKNNLFSSILYQATEKWVNDLKESNNENKAELLQEYSNFFEKIACLCEYILRNEITNIGSNNKKITRIYLECKMAILTLQAESNEVNKKESAKNKLYVIQKTIKQVKKKITTLNYLVENASLKSIGNLLPNIAGNEFIGIDTTLENEFKLNTETETEVEGEAEGVVNTMILLACNAMNANEIDFRFLEKYKSIGDAKSSYLQESTLGLFKKPKNDSNLGKIHHEIKSILQEIHDQETIGKPQKLKARFLQCVLDIEQQIEDETLQPETLQNTTIKVKLPGFEKYRTTLLGALEELSSEFDIHGNYFKEKPILTSNDDKETKDHIPTEQSILTNNDNSTTQKLDELNANRHNRLTRLLDKCYRDPNSEDSCIGLDSEEVTDFIATAFKQQDSKSRVSNINTVNRCLFVIKHSSCTEIQKRLFRELLLNKMSTNENLDKHRSPLNREVGIFSVLGVFFNYVFPVVSPYEWSGEAFVVESFSGAFTGTSFKLMGGGPLAIQPYTVTKRSILRHFSQQDTLITKFIKELDKEPLLTATTLKEKIDQFIEYNLKDSSKEFKTYIEQQILAFGIDYIEGKKIPLIMKIVEEIEDPKQRSEIFIYYCNCSLVLNEDETYESKFNKLLTSSKHNTYEATLQLCQILAIIANRNLHDPNLSQIMIYQLANALDSAITDEVSNWHKLVISRQVDNLVRTFIITTLYYLATMAVSIFAIAATPFAPIINILLCSAALIIIRWLRDWLTRTFKSIDIRIIKTAKRDLEYSGNYIPRKTFTGSPLIDMYQQERLKYIIKFYKEAKEDCTVNINDKIGENYYEHRRWLKKFAELLIKFWNEQTYDSVSLIKNLELIRETINKLNLNEKDVEFLRLELQNALEGDKLKEILKYEKSNILLSVITAIIYNIGNTLTLSGATFLVEAILNPFVIFLKVTASTTNTFQKMLNEIGIISENEAACNEILDEIFIPQEGVNGEIKQDQIADNKATLFTFVNS